MPALMEDGRAKVNLTLRVVGRGVDGYHDLESVVAFADCADRLSLTPGSKLNLRTTGPLAQDCGETADNLVFKAAELLGERVPDLKPEDPTINDHLGDAYWRIGRTLEAKFQWAHARDLKPEPEELPKIEAKIENGLPEDTSSAASADKKKEDGRGG